MKIQSSVTLMSPCLRRLYLRQLATCNNFKCLCNSHISLVCEIFLPFPHFHFHRCFCGIQNEGKLSSSVSVPSAFLSLCLIYSTELQPERKWEEKVEKGGFGFALRSHHFSGGK